MIPNAGHFDHDDVGQVCYEFERTKVSPEDEESDWSLSIFFEFPDPRPDVMPGDDWLTCSYDAFFDEKPKPSERDLRNFFDKVAPRLW